MKNILLTLVAFTSLAVSGQKRPKLVIGIVVDQMKTEYLYRFSDDFSEGGFKRLMTGGFTFHNMHYNYMPTYTGPGHASIYTGTTPSTHGIVGNEWFNKATGKELYCTDDSSVITVGNGSKSEGEMSPKNLQSTTITDELKLATNFKGKVIGMSIKDRGAILPAGHFADWAFWYSKTGSFVSSSFYKDKLPDWVTTFNNEKRFQTYANKGWNLLKPKEVYNESLPDDNPYEGTLYKKPAFFPYNMKEMLEQNDAGVIRVSPYGNNLLADFAMKAIENEALGKDDVTDFLTVSFSSTDYIGHTFGSRSQELQDTYLRLDETIGTFLNYLDTTVGKENYLIFLTADHAAAENANHLKDNKYTVESINHKNIEQSLIDFSKLTYGEDLLLNYSNYNIFFKKDLIAQKKLDLNQVKKAFTTFLYTQKQVKKVYSEEEILTANGADYYLNFIAKGYDPTQNGELIVLDKPGFMQYMAKGTTHGTPYTYDTHVPCIFYGWNIKNGESYDKKEITQIAPTLAFKLKITLPNGTEAKVLEEVLR